MAFNVSGSSTFLSLYGRFCVIRCRFTPTPRLVCGRSTGECVWALLANVVLLLVVCFFVLFGVFCVLGVTSHAIHFPDLCDTLKLQDYYYLFISF